MNRYFTNTLKKIFFICSCAFILMACKDENIPTNKTVILKENTFKVSGTLENFYPQKVYLNKIIENSLYIIDSSEVTANKFYFDGFVEYPERFALSFKHYSTTVVLLLENTEITITINAENLENTIIRGSKLNTEFNNYQSNSKKIFKKITYLFPQFQKYRLENNAKKLAEINNQMEAIEQEYIKYSYKYIEQNNNSYIAAMVLRDQLKSSTIDTLKISAAYKNLTENIKKSPDAQIIALTLNLH